MLSRALALGTSALMRILVADQNAQLLAAIASTFGRHCVVVTQTQRDACLEHLTQERFDVIVACERLRDFTGLELLSEVETLSPHTLRIFSALPERLAQLKPRLDHFDLLGTLSYPIDHGKLLLALKVARAKLGPRPKIRHVVLESYEPPTLEATPAADAPVPAQPEDIPVIEDIDETSVSGVRRPGDVVRPSTGVPADAHAISGRYTTVGGRTAADAHVATRAHVATGAPATSRTHATTGTRATSDTRAAGHVQAPSDANVAVAAPATSDGAATTRVAVLPPSSPGRPLFADESDPVDDPTSDAAQASPDSRAPAGPRAPATSNTRAPAAPPTTSSAHARPRAQTTSSTRAPAAAPTTSSAPATPRAQTTSSTRAPIAAPTTSSAHASPRAQTTSSTR